MKELIDQRVREGVLKPKEGVDLQNFYEGVLNGYTYVEHDKPLLIPPAAVTAGRVHWSRICGFQPEPFNSSLI